MASSSGPAILGPARVQELLRKTEETLRGTDIRDTERLTAKDVALLERFLNARITRDMNGKIDYLDEVDLEPRLRLIREIHQIIETDSELPDNDVIRRQAAFWGLLLTSNLQALNRIHRKFLDTDERSDTYAQLISSAQNAPNFIRSLLGKPDTSKSPDDTSKPPDDTKELSLHGRNASEKKRARARDGGRCVVTGDPVIEVAHIIPFAIKNRDPQKTGELFQRFGYFIGTGVGARLQSKFQRGDKNMIDHVSNMICLGRKLHHYMGQGLWALERVSDVMSRVKTETRGTDREHDDVDVEMTQPEGVASKGNPAVEAAFAKVTRTFAGPSGAAPAAPSPSRIGPAVRIASTAASSAVPSTAPSRATSTSRRSSQDSRRSERQQKQKKRQREAEEVEAARKKTAAEAKNLQANTQYGKRYRLHWLQSTSLASAVDTPPAVDSNPRDMWRDLDVEVGDLIPANGRPVDSGHIVDIWADNERDLPDDDFVDIWYFGFRLQRITGGADPQSYETDSEDESHGEQVASYLEMLEGFRLDQDATRAPNPYLVSSAVSSALHPVPDHTVTDHPVPDHPVPDHPVPDTTGDTSSHSSSSGAPPLDSLVPIRGERRDESPSSTMAPRRAKEPAHHATSQPSGE
ncbi:hypothetical protein CTRI78_v006483 [Colletotrichum trifolii]|uniref:HNH nuclease domain-containing protein n=1 Tax=Colletotrichum trifolii TaxID=5466 RepID=A0A4R8RCM1_COLTR|nr:hypothetical protein CTRI78_v006483 [Colletotrichum trifolii]